MHTPSNIAKSSVLANFIFWIVGSYDVFSPSLFLFVIISFIPIFICCALTIILTICPFFWLAEAKNFDKQQIFKMYFPYYSIVCFALCTYGVLSNSNESFLVGFFVAAFITTMQSWVWFAKESL